MNDLLHHPGSPRRRLRELMSGGQLILAPGVYDAMSARLVEAAGFPAVYMSGFGVTASVLSQIGEDGTPVRAMAGLPDMAEFFGIIGLNEVDELGRRFGRG
jgi:2-methylisocitrate lyase-like PEP mutase family enzyme